MDSQTLLHLFLTLHITAFTLMGGIIAADSAIYVRIRKYLATSRQQALIMLEGNSKFHLLISTGAILLIITGIGMVVIFHGVVAQMLWFRIKMVLVVFIVLNGALIARPGVLKLKEALATYTTESDTRIAMLQKRLNYFYVIQLTMFLAIFFLSAFKF